MKFLFALCVCVLFVSAFGEEDKKVDKRDVIVGDYGLDWPYFDYSSYDYYHGIYKRDISAHSIQKRDVSEENKPKTEEKRDLLLGYGNYPYFRNFPYYTGYNSYPYYNFYKNYRLY